MIVCRTTITVAGLTLIAAQQRTDPHSTDVNANAIKPPVSQVIGLVPF
jgi:hypothetical protein